MASLGEKRTPMAWQHRDMNYHHGGYPERYGQGYELNGIRTGPPSTSDRLSHRTDKSWHTQRDSQAAYPPSRPSYSTGRPPSQPHSAVTSSTTSTSSSESDTENEDPRGPMHIPHFPPQPIYGGYDGYYPGYPPSVSHYPGTLKSAKSVPAIGTWDGEPCPVHGIGPLSLPGPMPPPMMMPPHAAFTLPAKKANSIYDMRILAHHPPPPPPPSVGAIYSTLPVRPPGMDRRSLVGAPAGIPPQLLPPMARPRPLVLSEGGTTEPLPVRSPQDKANTLPLDVASKMADANKDEKHKECRGGLCVGMIVMGVICTGLLLGILLVFIL